MYLLCVDCKQIYKFNIYYRLITGIVLIGISIPFIFLITTKYIEILQNPQSYIFDIVIFIFATIVLVLGIKILSNTFRKERNCNICNGEKTLIKIDTPEAIEIIKKHDLSIPSESPEQTKAPTT